MILRGAGDKAFAAGADIAEFETERADAAQAREYGRVVEATPVPRQVTEGRSGSRV